METELSEEDQELPVNFLLITKCIQRLMESPTDDRSSLDSFQHVPGYLQELWSHQDLAMFERVDCTHSHVCARVKKGIQNLF